MKPLAFAPLPWRRLGRLRHVQVKPVHRLLFIGASAFAFYPGGNGSTEKGKGACGDRDFVGLAIAALFALAAGLIVAFANPAPRIEADLHADTSGLVRGIESSARLVEHRSSYARL